MHLNFEDIRYYRRINDMADVRRHHQVKWQDELRDGPALRPCHCEIDEWLPMSPIRATHSPKPLTASHHLPVLGCGKKPASVAHSAVATL